MLLLKFLFQSNKVSLVTKNPYESSQFIFDTSVNVESNLSISKIIIDIEINHRFGFYTLVRIRYFDLDSIIQISFDSLNQIRYSVSIQIRYFRIGTLYFDQRLINSSMPD